MTKDSSVGLSTHRLLWPWPCEKPRWDELVAGGRRQPLYQHGRVVQKSVLRLDPTLVTTVFYLSPSHKTPADSPCTSKAMLETTVMAVLDPPPSCHVLLGLSLLFLNLVTCDEQQALDNDTVEVLSSQVLLRPADKNHLFVCLSHHLH
jgi:hypothetical protein